MTQHSLTAAEATGVRSQALASAVAAFLIGAFLIFGVGFVHIPAVHNAAHDTRHSFAFPCH